MKRCPRCEETKPTTEFHNCKTYKSGLASWCKVCKAQSDALAYAADPAKEKARVHAWQKKKRAERDARRAAQPVPVVTAKRCAACETDKPLDAFAKAPRRKDGLSGFCKACHNARHAAKVEALRAQRAAGLLIHATPPAKPCKACGTVKASSEYSRSIAAKDGLMRTCKPCTATKTREWEKRMPAKSHLRKRGNCAKRRALQKGATVGVVDYFAIATRDNFACYLCARFIPVGEIFHFDHVVPLSKGGAHSEQNVRVACASCNLSKGDKLAPA